MHHATRNPSLRHLALLVFTLMSASASGALAASEGVWTEIPPTPVSAFHAAVYDPIRDRMLIWGGLGGRSVWALSLQTHLWSFVPTTGTAPPDRRGHSLVYDAANDRLIVFGGWSGSAFVNDVWALSLSGTPHWSQLTPTGVAPSPRSEHAAAYATSLGSMLVFGGFDGSRRNDTWRLDLSGTPSWTAMTIAGPKPQGRHSHAAIYDPVRNRLIVSGGWNDEYLAETWALNLSGTPAWTQIDAADGGPAARKDQAAVYDSFNDRLVIFGGQNDSTRSDVWSLGLSALGTWSPIAATGEGPAARRDLASIYDPARHQLIIQGGWKDAAFGEAWSLALSGTPAWTRLTPLTSPGERVGEIAFRDAVDDRMLLIEGERGHGYLSNEVWSNSLGAPVNWQFIPPSGAPPPPTSWTAGGYEAARERFVIFGGYTASLAASHSTWALTLRPSIAWNQVTTTGDPVGRESHTAIVDPSRDRLLVYGGFSPQVYDQGDNSGILGDLWSLNLTTGAWSEITGSQPSPGPREGHSAIYDPFGDRMLVFGGVAPVNVYGGVVLNDLWALDLPTMTWNQLAPTGTPPTPRYFSIPLLDPANQRILFFSGDDFDFNRYDGMDDVWELSLRDTLAWRVVETDGTPLARTGRRAAVYDPERKHLVSYSQQGWLSILDMSATTAAPDAPADAILFVSQPTPTPTSGPTRIRMSLPASTHVEAVLFDLGGRRVRQLANGVFAAGQHVLRWDGREEGGAMVRPGVYFLRASVGPQTFNRRLVVIQ